LDNSREVAINVILYRAELSRTMSTSTNSVRQSTSSNEIFIGKKPLMTYVTATLVQLANEPTVVIKARGKSITRAVDVAQIIVKRMDTLGYKIGPIKLGSETVQSDDGKVRNVSTIEVPISRTR
jgi:DNA-binding protein